MIASLVNQWWFWPSAAAGVLISIHTYLGLHVISRKVLFVDLALAQIAALGSTVTALYGYEMDDAVTYYVSLLFAIVGAWVFSVTRTRDDRVPQEAIIGLSFAIASAGSVLLSAKNPHGAEHLQHILSGSILSVSAQDGAMVKRAAALYAVIGAVHWALRRRFLLISTDPEAAAREGMHVRGWDFLFYVTFALVITMSVHIAGVLLVFCLLIAPAVCGALLADRFALRLLIGWGTSVVAAAGGLALSGYADWPPAPCIICVYAALLIGSGVGVHVLRASRPWLTAGKVAGAGAALAAVGFGLVGFLESDWARSLNGPEGPEHAGQGRVEDTHTHGPPEHALGGTVGDLLQSLWDEHENVRAKAAEDLGRLKDPAVVPELVKALKDPSDAVKEKAAEALGALGKPDAAPALDAVLDVPGEDAWVALRVAEALCRCGGTKGMSVLLRLAAEGDAKRVRAEALAVALAFAGRPAIKDPASAEAQTALKDAVAWWKDAQAKARWDAAAGRFVTGP